MKLLIRDQENIEPGKELGELSTGIRQVKNNMERFSSNQLASLLGFDSSTILRIIDGIQTHPDWSNEELAAELLEECNHHNSDE